MLETRVDRVRRTATVHEDWIAWLPDAKDCLFASTHQELETSYISLSVALNDAFTLCRQGMFRPARKQAVIFADLFGHTAGGLRGVLRALYEHGCQFGTLPNFAPLRSDYFRSERAQQVARTSSLFSFLILRSHKRFFRKLGAVEQIVADLHKEARSLAQRIGGAIGERDNHVNKEWKRLEILHYDLNTCLCETTVMLKSFFCVLPCDELTEFRKRLLLVPGAAAVRRGPEPRLTNLARSAATGRTIALAGADQGNVPLRPQAHCHRDNSGSGDSISLPRMRPDGTSGSNETN